MTVYVVTHEPYHDNSCLCGVYSSLEAAKASEKCSWIDKPTEPFDRHKHTCYFDPEGGWNAEAVDSNSSDGYMIRARVLDENT